METLLAVISLLRALAPFAPILEQQINSLLDTIKQDGALTPEQREQVHQLLLASNELVEEMVRDRSTT